MAFEKALDLLLFRRRQILDNPSDYGPLQKLELIEVDQIEAALEILGWKRSSMLVNEPTIRFGLEHFERALKDHIPDINADVRVVEAALKIAARVMRPGVLEQAVIDAYRSDTVAEEVAVIRKTLTDAP